MGSYHPRHGKSGRKFFHSQPESELRLSGQGDIKNLHRCIVQINLYRKSPWGDYEGPLLLELHESAVAYTERFDIKLVVAPEVSGTIEEWLSRRPDNLRPQYTLRDHDSPRVRR